MNNYIRFCLFLVYMTDIIIKRGQKSTLIKYHTHTLVVLNLFRSFVLRRHFDIFCCILNGAKTKKCNNKNV